MTKLDVQHYYAMMRLKHGWFESRQKGQRKVLTHP